MVSFVAAASPKQCQKISTLTRLYTQRDMQRWYICKKYLLLANLLLKLLLVRFLLTVSVVLCCILIRRYTLPSDSVEVTGISQNERCRDTETERVVVHLVM